MRVGRRGRFVGLEMTRFHQPLRAVARFACIAALLCCCGFMPREKHAGQTQANELEGVYVAGTLTLDGDVAIVWENGVPRPLTDRKGNASAKAVFVYGEDVYVAGEVYAAARGCWDAVVWKNGVPQVQEASETGNAQVTAMVVSNGDVYVTGYVYQYTGHPKVIAAIWKNGALTRLTDGSVGAIAEAVAVSGNDVYVGGTVGNGVDNGVDRQIVTLWKNGVPQPLTDGKSSVNVCAVAVSDSAVYVAGTAFRGDAGNVAILWRNGTPIDLGNGLVASGMCVDGADVYVVASNADDSDGCGVLWKNGKTRQLSGSGYDVKPSAITVANRHVYVVGRADLYTVVVWRDGKSVSLPRPVWFRDQIPLLGGISVK